MQVHPDSSDFTHFTPVQPGESHHPTNQRLSAVTVFNSFSPIYTESDQISLKLIKTDTTPSTVHLNLARQLKVSQPRDSPSAKHHETKPTSRASHNHGQ